MLKCGSVALFNDFRVSKSYVDCSLNKRIVVVG